MLQTSLVLLFPTMNKAKKCFSLSVKAVKPSPTQAVHADGHHQSSTCSKHNPLLHNFNKETGTDYTMTILMKVR